VREKRNTMDNKTYSNLALALLLGMSLLIAGCEGSMVVYQKISSNGTSSGYMNGTFDLADVYAGFGIPQQSYAQADAEMKGPMCEQFASAFNNTNFSDISCDVKDAKLFFSANAEEQELNESDFFVKRGLFTVEYIFTKNSSDMMGSNSSGNVSQMKEFLDQGLEVKYYVEMPAQIFDMTGGQFNYKTAEFDVLELAVQNQTIYIKSKDTNSTTMSAFFISFLLIMILSPFVRMIIHRKHEKSQYKDKAGTVGFIFGFFFLAMLWMIAVANYVIRDGFTQICLALGAFVLTIALILSAFRYLGANFEVSAEGITYTKAFRKRTVAFSEIKKIERAKFKGIIWMKQDKIFTTPSGEDIQPSEIVTSYRNPRKGVIIFLKDHSSIFYNVKEIAWVMDAVNARIK
jgi:hypothetical protein